jgi:GT2 family glycosyltransferase
MKFNSATVFIIPIFKPNLSKLQKLIENLPGDYLIINNSQTKLPPNLAEQEINPGMNLGFGGGANLGISAASKSHSWNIVINQDLKVTKKSAFSEFLEKLNKLHPGLAGPFAGTLDENRWTTIFHENNQDINDFDYLSGSFLGIHTDVFNKIGGFYAPYFMYYEDAEYSVKAKKFGFPLHHVGIYGTIHEANSVLAGNTYLRSYYLARNHLLFIRRNAPLSVQFHEFMRMPKTLKEHHEKGEIGAEQGIRDFAIGRYGQAKEKI